MTVTRPILRRFGLPCAMTALLLLSLAYWWLENTAHEIFGTLFFALAIWHIALNLTWFRNLAKGRFNPKRATISMLNILLVATMTLLLATSIIISQSVFSFLPSRNSIAVREVHWFSAYWAMIIVGFHLGLQWWRVMATLRTSLRLSERNVARTMVVRMSAAVAGALGLWSFSVLDVWKKLTFTYSLDFWDFNSSVAPFFGYWIAVVSVPAIVTHYTMVGWRRRPQAHQRREIEIG